MEDDGSIAWLRDRIARLRHLTQGITDRQALDALKALIAEAEQRLKDMERDGRS